MTKVIRNIIAVAAALGLVYAWQFHRPQVSSRSEALVRLNKVSEKPWTPVLDSANQYLIELKDGVLELPSSTAEEKSLDFLNEFAGDLFSIAQQDLKLEGVTRSDRTKVIYRFKTGTIVLVFNEGLLMRVQVSPAD